MMMTRFVLHAILILAFLSGGLVPAGLTRCQVETSCCGCGPAMEAAGCCCGPEAAANSAPAPSRGADFQLDWSAQVTESVSADLVAPVAASTLIVPDPLRTNSASAIPLYLSYRAFLI